MQLFSPESSLVRGVVFLGVQVSASLEIVGLFLLLSLPGSQSSSPGSEAEPPLWLALFFSNLVVQSHQAPPLHDDSYLIA